MYVYLAQLLSVFCVPNSERTNFCCEILTTAIDLQHQLF